MKRVYLSIGGNIGDRKRYLTFAIDSLSKLPEVKVEAVASLYETAPVGPVEQPDFYNSALRICTSLSPLELLDKTQKIEREAHRERLIHWGPRTLDIDLIWMESIQMSTSKLTLPHSEANKRAFVLEPLSEIWLEEELAGQPLTYWLERIKKDSTVESAIKRLETNWYGIR